jgi:hypothetical protein
MSRKTIRGVIVQVMKHLVNHHGIKMPLGKWQLLDAGLVEQKPIGGNPVCGYLPPGALNHGHIYINAFDAPNVWQQVQ